jgi:hypothetical protein
MRSVEHTVVSKSAAQGTTTPTSRLLKSGAKDSARGPCAHSPCAHNEHHGQPRSATGTWGGGCGAGEARTNDLKRQHERGPWGKYASARAHTLTTHTPAPEKTVGTPRPRNAAWAALPEVSNHDDASPPAPWTTRTRARARNGSETNGAWFIRAKSCKVQVCEFRGGERPAGACYASHCLRRLQPPPPLENQSRGTATGHASEHPPQAEDTGIGPEQPGCRTKVSHRARAPRGQHSGRSTCDYYVVGAG